jgi:hypothetical protein
MTASRSSTTPSGRARVRDTRRAASAVGRVDIAGKPTTRRTTVTTSSAPATLATAGESPDLGEAGYTRSRTWEKMEV